MLQENDDRFLERELGAGTLPEDLVCLGVLESAAAL